MDASSVNGFQLAGCDKDEKAHLAFWSFHFLVSIIESNVVRCSHGMDTIVGGWGLLLEFYSKNRQ